MNGLGQKPQPRKPKPAWPTLLRQCQEDWKGGQQERRFAMQIDHHTTQLRIQMTTALELASQTQPSAKEAAVLEVTELLKDTSKENNIDDCIRWLILFGLADQAVWEEWDIELIQILVNLGAYLAFENPNAQPNHGISQSQSAGADIWDSQCMDLTNHWAQKKRSTPFHRAAANGNAKAVRHMISSLKEYCKTLKQGDLAYLRPMFSHIGTTRNPVLGILGIRDPNGERALQQAAKAEKGNLETLEVLLSYPEVAAPPDTTFRDALDNGAVDVVQRFLQHDDLRKAFVTSENIIHAMSKIPRQKGQAPENGTPRIEIVNLLIQHAGTDKIFNRAVVEKIIALNLTGVWEERPRNLKLDEYFPLHLAILHQSLEFVKLFVEDYKGTVAQQARMPETDGTGYYPLWYNNRKWDRSKSKWAEQHGSRDIRTEVVTATIKQTPKMHSLSNILQQSAEKVRELCFDISLFNSKSYRLYEFVSSLIAHNENETLLEYEPTIKYARFPPMDLHPDDKEVFGERIRDDHREVFDVLDWLRKSKRVKSVIELNVPDRLVNPHNELQIAKYVKDFGVEILDWRFLDLSLSVFDEKVKPKIRGLHLYASGKRAVISHWISEQGVESFCSLAWLHVHVIQETMTKDNCERTCRFIRRELKLLRRRLRPSRNLEYIVKSQPWNPKRDGLADLEELAQRAFPKLSQFILSYRTLVSKTPPPEGFTPTKVAIIDNGIMSMSPTSYEGPRNQPRRQAAGRTGQGSIAATLAHSKMQEGIGSEMPQAADPNTSAAEMDEDDEDGRNDNSNNEEDHNRGDMGNQKRRDRSKGYRTLWSRIKQGRSFVDDDFQLSPWLFASDPHGTQMANLICAIDPACELHVAKVTDGRNGITPHRVARAIQWAIDEGVDVISMSFSILETSDSLDQAISAAGLKGIVLLCSTHDEGSNVGKAWPAASPATFAVTACDEYGSLFRAMKEESYKYKLQGLNVAAGVIPFLDSTDRISGSSVATAVAAGLSSLVLSCLRLANPGQKFEGGRRVRMVEEKLDEMLSKGTKYVLLEKFGGIDKRVKRGEPINAEVILGDAFKTDAPLRITADKI